jgi:hypothetical protein
MLVGKIASDLGDVTFAQVAEVLKREKKHVTANKLLRIKVREFQKLMSGVRPSIQTGRLDAQLWV